MPRWRSSSRAPRTKPPFRAVSCNSNPSTWSSRNSKLACRPIFRSFNSRAFWRRLVPPKSRRREHTRKPNLRWTGPPAEPSKRITSRSTKPIRAASLAHRPKFHEEARMIKTRLIAALLILQLGRAVSAQEMSFGSCQVFGQVFGIDPLGGDMLVKSPSGNIGGLRFDQTTVFERASLNTTPPVPARITPGEVNEGDLVCARASGKWDSVAMAASQVVVASRSEIQKQQKAKLLQWSNAGVSGSVV